MSSWLPVKLDWVLTDRSGNRPFSLSGSDHPQPASVHCRVRDNHTNMGVSCFEGIGLGSVSNREKYKHTPLGVAQNSTGGVTQGLVHVYTYQGSSLVPVF